MADIKQRGDWVVFKQQRPTHWSKDGSMDHWLGKRVQVTGTYVWGGGNNGRFWFEGGPTDKEFLFSDINPYGSGDYAAVTSFKPYELPIDDIKAALVAKSCTPKKWEPAVGALAQLIVPVKVFRDFGNGTYDVHTDDGNCLMVSKLALHKAFIDNFNQDYIMKAQRDAVIAVAKRLCKANNTVTTLEIKVELRRDYPYYFWTQQAVSDYMSQLAGDGIFTYTDNGTFRTYSVASPAQVAQTAGPVSKQIAAKTTTTSSSAGIAKVSGTLATAPKRGRGRPRKNQNTAFTQTAINRSLAMSYAIASGFESFTFGNKTVTRADIRAQKKSPAGYLSNTKLNKLDAITVNGKTYQVK
jgi:hypothetical protein